jgi:TfoX/Sxy family transcriptional regulator of competence genes
MAYDESLADRIRDYIPKHATEKKMFGGICFLDRANLACGVVNDKMMLRLTKDLVAQYRQEPDTADMDFTKRPMLSMTYVLPEAVADNSQLRVWVERAFAFTCTLPSR